MEGGTSAVGALDGPWRRWPAGAVVEEEPFLFFIDSAICRSFCRFNRWNQKRNEKDEVWALWDVIW